MSIYCDGFLLGKNPCELGGYTITSQKGKLLSIKFIKKEELTNNEVELRAIYEATKIAKNSSKIITDSQNSILWIKRAMKGKILAARPDLTEIAKLTGERAFTRNLEIKWEPRERNLAGKLNENKYFLKEELKKSVPITYVNL